MNSDFTDFVETVLQYWPWRTSTSQPKETQSPKLEERAPFPPDGPIEILPPIDDAKTIEKRKAADKEFWSTL